MTPTEQLKALHVAIHELVDLQYSTYNRSLLPLLEKTVCISSESMSS